MSAVASVVSLGWGVAAYSSAMRMSLPVKSKLTYAGMFFQTLWRLGMIAARLVSLVLLSLALQEMTFVAICKSCFFSTIEFMWDFIKPFSFFSSFPLVVDDRLGCLARH